MPGLACVELSGQSLESRATFKIEHVRKVVERLNSLPNLEAQFDRERESTVRRTVDEIDNRIERAAFREAAYEFSDLLEVRKLRSATVSQVHRIIRNVRLII